MIADALRTELERHRAKSRSESLLCGVDLRALRANADYLVLHTAVQLRRAQDRALTMGEPRLATHFGRIHEWGAPPWADDETELPSDGDIVPAARELENSLGSVIEDDPTLYLAHLTFIEYLTGVLLRDRSGHEPELERVEESLDHIDELVGDPRKLPRMRQMLRASIAGFERMCVQIAEMSDDAWHARRAPAQVSAA